MSALTARYLHVTGLHYRLSGALATDADTVVKAKVLDSGGNISFAEAPLEFVEAGEWELVAPASAFPEATGPWIIVYTVYDATGSVIMGTRRVKVWDTSAVPR